MRRTLAVIVAVSVWLAVVPAGAGAANDYQQVLQVYEREGTIGPCQFTAPQLQSALGGVDTYGAQYFADFTQAVQAALSSRAGGACATVAVAGGGAGSAAGGGAGAGAGPARSRRSPVPPPPSVALTAATSAEIPLPLALLGGLVALGAVGLVLRAATQRGRGAE